MKKIIIIDKNQKRFEAMCAVFIDFGDVEIYRLFMRQGSDVMGIYRYLNVKKCIRDQNDHVFDLMLLHGTDSSDLYNQGILANKKAWFGGIPVENAKQAADTDDVIYRSINNADDVLQGEEIKMMFSYYDGISEKPSFFMKEGMDQKKDTIIRIIDILLTGYGGRFNQEAFDAQLNSLSKNNEEVQQCKNEVEKYIVKIQKFDDGVLEDKEKLRNFYSEIAQVRNKLFNRFCEIAL